MITPTVRIMRNSADYNLYDTNEFYIISVVNVAAPDLNKEQFDLEKIKRTLTNMYICVKEILPDADALILGAWDVDLLEIIQSLYQKQ